MWNFKNTEIIDISPEVSPQTAVFPGDQKFVRNISMDTTKGDHISLSAVTTTLHIGAHADSSSHYHAEGDGVEKRPLSAFMGECQVITVSGLGNGRIPALKTPPLAKRVLFRTLSFPDPNHWNNDFTSLSPELIDQLGEHSVELVGIDTPSVDPVDSKDLPSHAALFRNQMAVLEGIVLSDVADGLYTLVALPLRWKDADASPVRAILLKDQNPG